MVVGPVVVVAAEWTHRRPGTVDPVTEVNALHHHHPSTTASSTKPNTTTGQAPHRAASPTSRQRTQDTPTLHPDNKTGRGLGTAMEDARGLSVPVEGGQLVRVSANLR